MALRLNFNVDNGSVADIKDQFSKAVNGSNAVKICDGDSDKSFYMLIGEKCESSEDDRTLSVSFSNPPEVEEDTTNK